MFNIGDTVKCVKNPSDNYEDSLVGFLGIVKDVDYLDDELIGLHVDFPAWGGGWGEDDNEWWVDPDNVQLVRKYEPEPQEEVNEFDAFWEELNKMDEEAEERTQFVIFATHNPEYGSVEITHNISVDANVTAHLALFERYLKAKGFGNYEIIARYEIDGEVGEHSSFEYGYDD